MEALYVLQALFIVLFFMLGAVLASFTGVIAERIYTGQSWLTGRSRCNSCRRTLDGFDLVPVFSWLAFRGRCRTCRSRVPGSYALFEGALGATFAVSYATLGLTLALGVFLAALTVLAFVVLYDLRHTIVPWGSTLLLGALSFIFACLRAPSLQVLGQDALVAGVIGIAFFLLYALSRGRGMGLGDAPIAFSLSLLVGGAALPGLVFSFWIGAVIGIFILVLRRGGPKMGIEVPFVPFLAIGYLLAFFTQWNPFLF
jgi:prepilin signal peptidase PulO-like enzyme (type II secretory pathway)